MICLWQPQTKINQYINGTGFSLPLQTGVK